MFRSTLFSTDAFHKCERKLTSQPPVLKRNLQDKWKGPRSIASDLLGNTMFLIPGVRWAGVSVVQGGGRVIWVGMGNPCPCPDGKDGRSVVVGWWREHVILRGGPHVRVGSRGEAAFVLALEGATADRFETVVDEIETVLKRQQQNVVIVLSLQSISKGLYTDATVLFCSIILRVLWPPFKKGKTSRCHCVS